MIISEIKQRRSIRKYRDLPVEKEKLDRILEAGRLAPTARNSQNWNLIIVDSPEARNTLVDAATPHQPFAKQAPVILVACATDPEYIMRCGIPAYPLDLAIVLDHISLQAVKEGLGTCWIGSFYQHLARQALNVPENITIVQLMTLGYPAEDPPRRPRKKSADLIRFNRWT